MRSPKAASMFPLGSVALSLWILATVSITSASRVCLVNPLEWQNSRALSTLSQNYNTQSFFSKAKHYTFQEAQDPNTKDKCDLIIVTGSSGSNGVKDETTRQWTKWDSIEIRLQGPIVWETCQCDPVVKQKNKATIFCHKAVIIPRLLDNKYSLLSVPSTYWKLPVGMDDNANNCFNLIKTYLSDQDAKAQKELKRLNVNYQIQQKKFSLRDVVTAADQDNQALVGCRQSLKSKLEPQDQYEADARALLTRILSEKILRETPNYLNEVSDRMLLMNVKSEIFTSKLFTAVTAIKPIIITDFLVDQLKGVALGTRMVKGGVIGLLDKPLFEWDGVVTAQDIQQAPRIPLALIEP